MGYWLSFAATGDPNHDNAPLWPRWNDDNLLQTLAEDIKPEALDGRLCSGHGGSISYPFIVTTHFPTTSRFSSIRIASTARSNGNPAQT